MAFPVASEPVPIREDSQGALRLGETRVLLDLVVRAFDDGATPEAIVQRYSSLDLPDVYSAIAYYLRHRGEVLEYLRRRERRAAEVERMVVSGQRDLSEIRGRLLSKRTPPAPDHADLGG